MGCSYPSMNTCCDDVGRWKEYEMPSFVSFGSMDRLDEIKALFRPF